MGRLASFETWAELVPKKSTGPFFYHSGPKDFKVLELTQEPALQYHCGSSRGLGLLWGRAAPEKFLLSGRWPLLCVDPDTFTW